jgi:hypothetical protein
MHLPAAPEPAVPWMPAPPIRVDDSSKARRRRLGGQHCSAGEPTCRDAVVVDKKQAGAIRTLSQLLGVELPLGLEEQELGWDDANEWITRHWDAFIAIE